MDNMKHLGKDNEKKQGWLSEANTWSCESNRTIVKQEGVIKNQERMVVCWTKQVKNELGEKLEKIKKSDHIEKKSITKEKRKISDHGLVDNQDVVNKEKVRKIFFYDILKYRKNNDIGKELSKIGKVFSIKVRSNINTNPLEQIYG